MSKKVGIYQNYVKRTIDLILSFVACIMLSPIMLVVATLVRFKIGKNIIFKQNRPGKDGKIFCMYKFRTMTNEMNKDGVLLSDEIRLTKFGKILRSTSLDELPELWNIVKGDMSIVGPRPLLIQYLPLYNEKQRQRHDVKPGITGLAQVNGRNSICWEEKLEWDVRYVNHITFMGDILIILKTVKIVFTRVGINSETSATMEEFRGGDK